MINFVLGAVAMAFLAVVFPSVPQLVVAKLKEFWTKVKSYVQ